MKNDNSMIVDRRSNGKWIVMLLGTILLVQGSRPSYLLALLSLRTRIFVFVAYFIPSIQLFGACQ